MSEAVVRRQRLETAQASFLTSLLKHPEYASFVRSLSWTLTFGPEWFGEYQDPVEKIISPHDQTWQVLELLSMVRDVDLASEHMLMRHSYVRDCPEMLFPAATKVRLSGVMDQRLVHSMISHRSHRLESLCIDDVQHWGLHADGRPLTVLSERNALRLLEQEPGMYPPGPMRGIFDSSVHYSDLRYLLLRKAASQTVADKEWVPDADIAVYKEWAILIRSVKHHLRCLVFEQSSRPLGRDCRQDRRPMDRRFQDHLLPLFLESGWDSLERLEIRGVGRWHQENPIVMDDATKKSITDAVGSRVSILIAEEQSREAYMWRPPAY